MQNQVRELRQSETRIAVIVADLDHFKQLNDTYGHEAGDRALRLFARVVREAIRPQDLVCRHGGEEVALALPVRTVEDAARICERIREELALAVASGSHPVFTTSFGIAPPDDEATYEELIARADGALYRAKQAGRNRTVIHVDGAATPRPAVAAVPTEVVPADAAPAA
jgi:diguanylate cyclase (GGDEF)-like protein